MCICPLQVIFEHEGVFIHPGSDEDGIEQDLIISGSLRIVDKVRLIFHSLIRNIETLLVRIMVRSTLQCNDGGSAVVNETRKEAS